MNPKVDGAAGDGSHVPLQGVDDGTQRIRLGRLHLANACTLLTFTAETNSPTFDRGAWYAQHLNTSNSVVDFGDARTDGSVWLRREGNVWFLKTWPRQRNFTLEFNRARFDQPNKVQSTGGAAPAVNPLPTGSRWALPLNGASQYRWTNPPPRLSILRSNQAEVVSWPASADNFLLEATADLALPANWNPVTNPVTNTNGQISVLLPSIGARQFHRLKLLQ